MKRNLIITASLLLATVCSLCGQTYKIGDLITNPDGSKGIVFYVTLDRTDGWMVALNDLPVRNWGNTNDIPTLQNISDLNERLLETDGYHNTDNIRQFHNQLGYDPNTYGAGVVDFPNEWYIPATGQLMKLISAYSTIETKILQAGGTKMLTQPYFTSTEAQPGQVWVVHFGSPYNDGGGRFENKPKDEICYFRAVRNIKSQTTPLPEPSFPDNILETDCNLPWEGFEWGIREDWSTSDNIYCRIMPLVGDLDDDGIPEIVCFDMEGNDLNQIAAKTINVYDGQSKALKAQISMNGMVWAHGNGPYGLVKLPNRKGLIITACKDRKLHAYDITSDNPNNPVWVSNADYNTGNNDFSVSIGFADFNGDRFPEIYVRNKIFDAETGTLLAVAQGGNNQADSYSHGSHTNHDKISCPLAFNICGDTRQELILGNEIYEVIITNRNGTSGNQVTLIKNITPPDNIIADGHVQVADFNLDGHLDVLVSNRDSEGVTGNVSFYVWDVHNNTTSRPIKLNTSFIGKGIPLISDFDGDGSLEMLIDCCHEPNLGLRAYRFNPTSNSFNYLWSLPIDEDSYSNTATLFDFNGDCRNELVFTDNSNLWIYDLGTVPPTLLSQIDCGEITIMQVPIVADVDADGSAEIVVTGKEGGYLQANTKLKVYKSSTEPWIPARKVWNQYMYHVTNVNEDLTIPTFCFDKATTFTAPDGTVRRPYNNFLQQAGYINQYGEPYNPGGIIEADIFGSGCVSFTFHDSTYYQSGIYDQLVETSADCDTLYHVNVSIGGTVTHEFSDVFCGQYIWNDTVYHEPGDYTQHFVAPAGCDSIVTLHLSLGEMPAVPNINGPQEVYVSTDMVLGEYLYSLLNADPTLQYDWELVGADWVMHPDGSQCSLLVTTPGTATLKVKAWNDCGFSEQEIIIHAGFHDVNEHDAVRVRLYPNPAKDKVYVEAEGIVSVRFYDMRGRYVSEVSEKDDQKVEINLQNLSSKLYVVEVVTNQGVARAKLNIETP